MPIPTRRASSMNSDATPTTGGYPKRITHLLGTPRMRPSRERQFSSGLKKSILQSQVHMPRLVARNLPFEQSKNSVAVINEKHHSHIWRLLCRDWFHVLLRIPAGKAIPLLLVIWTALILAFAGIYYRIDRRDIEINCGLGQVGDPITWPAAFAFSLETCTTVGYGLPGDSNAFFEANCGSVQATIFFQMTWSMVFNAFLLAFFYNQLSRCESRSYQLVFADKICLRERDGKVEIQARCYDVDSAHPVVETHVRMYLMDVNMALHPLRLVSPNDELGGMLYTSIPTTITHQIDHHSALSPRKMPLVLDDGGLVLRSADSPGGSREEICCPVCGESYGSYERLKHHVEYNRIVESKDDFPKEGTHLGFEMPPVTPISLMEVVRHVERNFSEIIVVVEGIDPQVSGTFQSIQSYKFDDIAFEGEFAPCLSVVNNNFVVDLSRFHDVRYPDDNGDEENGESASKLFFAPPKVPAVTFSGSTKNENNSLRRKASDESPPQSEE